MQSITFTRDINGNKKVKVSISKKGSFSTATNICCEYMQIVHSMTKSELKENQGKALDCLILWALFNDYVTDRQKEIISRIK